MSDIAIKFENISKQYRLGEIGTGTLSHDLNRWWHKARGKEDPYLKVGSVNIRYEKAESEYVWALRDINLEVKQGEVLGIIGKNGAGKSTLLKILSKVTRPTTGNIRTKGRIASLLEVGTGFHQEMTGRENIYLNGAIMGMTKVEINRKFDEIVDFAGVERYIDTPVKRYSSGMTVRLGFAIAAHLEPEILVVDEVLAVGDSEFQSKATGKMQQVSKEKGRTVLFVTHNMDAIQTLCNTALLLSNGTSETMGSTEQVIAKYLHRFQDNQKINSVNLSKNGIIHEVKLLSNGKKTNAFHSGCEFVIQVNYISNHIIKNPVLGFVILNYLNVPLIGLNNAHYSQTLCGNNYNGSIQIRINSLPLSEGEYILNLWLGDGITDYDVVQDKITFIVTNSLLTKNTLVPNKKLNQIYIENIEWSIS